MSEISAVADERFDPRAKLGLAHREVARTERDRVSEALERSRAELQRLLEAQHARDAAREALACVRVTIAGVVDLENPAGAVGDRERVAVAVFGHPIATGAVLSNSANQLPSLGIVLITAAHCRGIVCPV